ncbi:stage V sporulation protein AB [Tepidimicrobium xylanilyticum]|uniref:stage V sporulation protein AB n=1 Tax=Tepidimicrobium xylanilyticum TaxID=1123352 RepID=UPI000B8699D4|nr:stage V sporulation protein AB [Tepidimicrobium xylanilyticum]
MSLGGVSDGKGIIISFISFSTGVTIGSAAAAFFTLLQIIPRLIQITGTKEKIKKYEFVAALGGALASLIYFYYFKLSISKYLTVLVGILIGFFYGLFASALAEVLNVTPVFAKKFKVKHQLKFIIWALILGKVFGSLFYWLIFIKN